MAYDEDLAERVRDVIGGGPEVTEKRMFGGLAWLFRGNMAVAALGSGGGLMVRVPPGDTDALLDEPGAGPMVMRGRPMNGWIAVSPEACDDPSNLAVWVERGLAYAGTLPPK